MTDNKSALEKLLGITESIKLSETLIKDFNALSIDERCLLLMKLQMLQSSEIVRLQQSFQSFSTSVDACIEKMEILVQQSLNQTDPYIT